MVKNVFSLNDVADFYNQNFINLKMHFGKEKELVEKYGTSGYPTFLFINGDGKLVYMESGYTEGDEFIAYGKTALEKAKGIEFIEGDWNRRWSKHNKRINLFSWIATLLGADLVNSSRKPYLPIRMRPTFSTSVS